jgi:hypothetical protein
MGALVWRQVCSRVHLHRSGERQRPDENSNDEVKASNAKYGDVTGTVLYRKAKIQIGRRGIMIVQQVIARS